jgi:hypothetical protein
MAIGPNGMGGPPVGNPMGAQNKTGGDIMAAKQRLMQIAAEAEAILSQHPELAQEMMGGGPEGATPAGPPGGIPRTPVAGNTGPPGGMPGLIA